MAHLVGRRMYVIHAGDSRCYLIRDGKAEQITTDHTLARQMVEAGGMKPEEEASSKWSKVLRNVLGGNADGDIIAEVHRVDLRVRDSCVPCSDGLYRYVDRETLAAVVDASNSPVQACEELIALANQQGAEDNITVVIACPDAASRRTTQIEHHGAAKSASDW